MQKRLWSCIFLSLFVSGISVAQQDAPQPKPPEFAADETLHEKFMAALSQRVMTVDVVAKMLQSQIGYQESVQTLYKKPGFDERGKPIYTISTKVVTGKQRKIIHQECLDTWRPIFKKISDDNDDFLRALGVSRSRILILDEAEAKWNQSYPGLSISDTDGLQLLLRTDGTENCNGPGDAEMITTVKKWYANPTLKKALADTINALETIEKIAGDARDFAVELKPLLQ